MPPRSRSATGSRTAGLAGQNPPFAEALRKEFRGWNHFEPFLPGDSDTELQEKEFAAEAEGYSAVKHQACVGAGYFDEITSTCGQSSTQALRDSTEEHQFNGNAAA
jgi:hypothetical protein